VSDVWFRRKKEEPSPEEKVDQLLVSLNDQRVRVDKIVTELHRIAAKERPV
jgi:hypothetical protein